ncbi:MAG: hypothetical protein J6D20_08100 [Clostridia bacterium]|nr:hypothetical protein [Clostridia bacterium]
MENQGQKKNPNKHLIISLSIIGAAVLVALIIAVVVIVSDLNNRIDGKNASELYASLESSVVSESNYSYTVQKIGKLMLFQNDGSIAREADIKNTEELRVDGSNLYYRKTITVDDITDTLEMTIIDGTAYICTKSTGEHDKFEKTQATSNNFRDSLTTIDSLIWDYDDLFKQSDPVETNGVYLIEMNKELALDDPAFIKAMKANAAVFIDDNITNEIERTLWKSCLKSFEAYDYDITYDGEGRPVSLSYGYAMGNGNMFVGDLAVTAGFEYGKAIISLPENVDYYN